MTKPAAPTLRNEFGTIHTILAGSALDAQSDEVVRTARDLARRTGAALVVAHAAPLPVLVPGMLLTESGLLERMGRELKLELQQQAERLELAALPRPPALRVEEGPPDLVLARIASACSADLVVVGATTASGRLGKLLGSTAERMLAWGEAPILVVREEPPVPPRRVLAPVDLSLLSRDAFRSGLRLLAQLAPAEPMEIEALLVVAPPAPEALPQTIRVAETELGDFLANSPAPGVRLRPRVLTGEAREQILRETEEEAWDLVLLGSRGTSGVRRALGSVTADVTREAPCSVLVVPPQAGLGEALAEAVEEQARPFSDWLTPAAGARNGRSSIPVTAW